MSNEANRPSTRQQVIAELSQIIGLQLTAGWRGADMRMLDFGTLKPIDGGSVGGFALHIQCPWRIEGPEGIVTGRLDLWEPVEDTPDLDWDTWDYEKSPNLQDFQFHNWFARHGSSLVVKSVDADEYGGVSISFSHGFVLRLFPAGTRGEDWRLFRPKTRPHFVISGGKVHTTTDRPRDAQQNVVILFLTMGNFGKLGTSRKMLSYFPILPAVRVSQTPCFGGGEGPVLAKTP